MPRLHRHYPHITHGLVRRLSRDPDFLRRVGSLMPYIHMRNSRAMRRYTTDNHRRRIALHILSSHARSIPHNHYMSDNWADFETS